MISHRQQAVYVGGIGDRNGCIVMRELFRVTTATYSISCDLIMLSNRASTGR